MTTFAELAELLKTKSKEQAHAIRSRTRTTRQAKRIKKESKTNV